MRTTRVTQYIDAPRARVYATLLDPHALARWKVPDGMTAVVHQFEAHEGGALRVSLTYDAPDGQGKTSAHTDTYHGRLVTLIPDSCIVEVDTFETPDPALRGAMTSTLTLADAGVGTEVVAVHADIPPGVSLADNETGWRMALAKLAALVEAREQSPKASNIATDFRLATADDLPAVVRLLADDPLGAEREQDADPLPAAYATAFAAMQAQSGNELLVATLGDGVVGCLQLTVIPGISRQGAFRAQIEGVRVASVHRGAGIGEVLIRHAIERARRAGCTVVQLTSDATRVEARRFYERLGFEASHVGMKLYLGRA